MIEESLKSMFTQINFFIHNLAQMKFSGHTEGALLSFIPKTYRSVSLYTMTTLLSVDIKVHLTLAVPGYRLSQQLSSACSGHTEESC